MQDPNLQEIPPLVLGVRARESNGRGDYGLWVQIGNMWGYLGDRQLFRGPMPWTSEGLYFHPYEQDGREHSPELSGTGFLSRAPQSSHSSLSLTRSVPGQMQQHPHPNHSHTRRTHTLGTGTPARRQRHTLPEPRRHHVQAQTWTPWLGKVGRPGVVRWVLVLEVLIVWKPFPASPHD